MESKKVENGMSESEWSTLPPDLIRDVSKSFDARLDLLHFRTVCSSWRSSSVTPPPKIPFVNMPIPKISSWGINEYKKLRDHFVLKETTIYSVQPTEENGFLDFPTGPITRAKEKRKKEPLEACIIKVEELPSGKLRPIFPLAHAYLRYLNKEMPKIAELYGNGHYWNSMHRRLPEKFNLLDYTVKEMGKAYGFKTMGADFSYSLGYITLIHKVVVSSDFQEIGDGFAVMIIDEMGGLFVWKVGDRDWTKINFKKNDESMIYFVDVIFHQGKFYAIDYAGLTITVDPKNFETIEVASENGTRDPIVIDFNHSYRRQMFLVESLGDLLWVKNLVDCFEKLQEGCERVDVLMYRLDKGNQQWKKVEKLEDRVFFLGDDARFSFSTNHFRRSKGSCLYFKFRYGCVNNNELLGVVELENGNLENVKISRFSPTDYYFKMLYLPPI